MFRHWTPSDRSKLLNKPKQVVSSFMEQTEFIPLRLVLLEYLGIRLGQLWSTAGCCVPSKRHIPLPFLPPSSLFCIPQLRHLLCPTTFICVGGRLLLCPHVHLSPLAHCPAAVCRPASCLPAPGQQGPGLPLRVRLVRSTSSRPVC